MVIGGVKGCWGVKFGKLDSKGLNKKIGFWEY